MTMQQNPRNITEARKGAAELKRLAARVARGLDTRYDPTWQHRLRSLSATVEALHEVEAIAAELRAALGEYGAVRGSEYVRYQAKEQKEAAV